MSDSTGKARKPDAQAESGKKHGDQLMPDLPGKQVGSDGADRVRGGSYDIKKVEGTGA